MDSGWVKWSRARLLAVVVAAEQGLGSRSTEPGQLGFAPALLSLTGEASPPASYFLPLRLVPASLRVLRQLPSLLRERGCLPPPFSGT